MTPFYDPLLAKLCVHAADRARALARAREAVAAFAIEGPKTNLRFHAELLDSPEFVSGDYDTSLITASPQALKTGPRADPDSTVQIRKKQTGVAVAEIRAEMVANVWKVVAAQGDRVDDGDTLVILESMKMEIPVLAETRARSPACTSPRAMSSRKATSSPRSAEATAADLRHRTGSTGPGHQAAPLRFP